MTAQDESRIPGKCQGSERLEPATLGRRIVVPAFGDYARRYDKANTPAPRFRPLRKLRSVAIADARIAFDGHCDLTVKVQGLPRLRARLQQELPVGGRTKTTVRIVRTREGMTGVGPGCYELRITIEVAKVDAAGRSKAETIITGWDPGGRASLTNDVGETISAGKRKYLVRMQRACARTKKGSKGRRKAYARTGRVRHNETTARDAHLHKQIAHAVRRADIHVVERNTHAAMRRKGGKRKRGMNRQHQPA